MISNCNVATLELFQGSLSQSQLRHLYRRIGFGASQSKILEEQSKTANEIIDVIISEAQNKENIPQPVWANWDITDYPVDDNTRDNLIDDQYSNFRWDYTKYLIDGGLKGRLSFFWSNHVVSGYTSHFCNSYHYQYIDCLFRNSIGNFKTLITEVGLTYAMLIYLDGAFNKKEEPNENYARELFELFTLGEGKGYTEQDIQETARALTGYFIEYVNHIECSPILFNPALFDNTDKTIFGRTGNWDYYDVIDILFEERSNEIAKFICTKLYNFFVHPDATSNAAKDVINGLSSTFISNNFELAPVLSLLFKSQHFFDINSIGVIIKSPYDLFLNMFNEIGELLPNEENLIIVHQVTRLAGQTMFNPPDVAGWQRDRDWINNNFLIARWSYLWSWMYKIQNQNKEYFRSFAMEISGDLGLTSSNPDEIARMIIDTVLAKGLHSEQDYQQAYVVFRADVSDSYYEGGDTPVWTLATWTSASNQVYLLMQYLVKEPDFQLK